METFWTELCQKIDSKIAIKNDMNLHKKLVKCFGYLQINPKHNSLKTHEIVALSNKYKIKIWQSYLENNKPAAARIYWAYGPEKNEITILGIEPHPNDKSNAYEKIKLSDLP